MRAGLRALLSGFLDYAGLFPPAQLPLAQAFPNFLGYRQHPDSWMLRGFVCPVAKLVELEPYADEFLLGERPLRLALLATASTATDWPGYLKAMVADLEAIMDFKHQHGDAVHFDSLELKLPDELWGEDRFEDFQTVVHGNFGFLEEAGAAPECAFYEAKFDVARFQLPATLLRCFVEDDQRCKGFKLRCGGATAAHVPTIEEVAFGILACRAPEIPLKFTAGLHHPFRHHDRGLDCLMHGFLNVFCAGVIAATFESKQENIDADTALVKAILEDQDPQNFSFDDNGLRWRDRHATVPQIEAARASAVISQGSCSFDEPREDLRQLGWL